jgi:hypothetical protein
MARAWVLSREMVPLFHGLTGHGLSSLDMSVMWHTLSNMEDDEARQRITLWKPQRLLSVLLLFSMEALHLAGSV